MSKRRIHIPFKKLTEQKKDEIIFYMMEHRCEEVCQFFNIGKVTLDKVCEEKFNPKKNRKNGTETSNDRETQKEVSNSRD